MTKVHKSLLSLREPLFFFAYVVFMTATVLQTTMYTELKVFPQVFIAMRYGAFVLAAFKVLLDLYADLKGAKGNRTEVLSWSSLVFKYLLLSLFVVAVSLTADERSLVFILTLLLAAKNVKVEKIFRVTLWLQIILFVFVVLSAASGIIVDLVFERKGIYNRHALGYWFPSYVMSYYFFVLLLLFWTEKKAMHWTLVALLGGLNLLFFLLTDARLGLMVNSIVIAAELIRSVDRFRVPVHAFCDKVAGIKVLGNFLKGCWVLLPELMCAFLVFLFKFPTTRIALYTDYFLSNRIYYAIMGVQTYGVHLLGNPIEWVGYGARADMSEVEKTYNFVDCSYPYILLNFGLILFAGLLLCLFFASRKLMKEEGYHKNFLFGIIFIYCFVEPRLLELNMDTFLFLTVPLLTAPLYRPGNPVWKIRQ